MNVNQTDFLSIVSNAVCGREEPLSPNPDWLGIWRLALRNHLEAIVQSFARAHGGAPSELLAQMEQAYYAAVAHDVQQRATINSIVAALRNSGIPYAPMKGCVLKNDYPASHLRFMCDVDLYIRVEDRGRADVCLREIGAMRTGESAGDGTYVIANTGLEPQSMLCYRLEHGQIVHYPDWSLVDEERNCLTEEGFALNLIGHCVGDIRKGGPGLRYVLDLWVYRHRHQTQPDWEFVYDRLRHDGIYDAAKNLLDLSEYLFGNGVPSPLMEEMADYVMSTSLYGDATRASTTEVALSGGRGGAIAHQVFRDRADYENRYPWLAGRPWLLPAAWVIRAGHVIRTRPQTVLGWLRGTESVSRSEADAQRDRIKRFGL